MKGKFLRSYVSKAGNDVFVYAVSGTPEQIAAFKTAQGDNIREAEDGTPLYFTTRYSGENISLGINQKGGVFVDNSEFKKANSLVKQYGGNLGQEMAKAAAAKLIGGGGSTVTEAQPASSPANLGTM